MTLLLCSGHHGKWTGNIQGLFLTSILFIPSNGFEEDFQRFPLFYQCETFCGYLGWQARSQHNLGRRPSKECKINNKKQRARDGKRLLEPLALKWDKKSRLYQRWISWVAITVLYHKCCHWVRFWIKSWPVQQLCYSFKASFKILKIILDLNFYPSTCNFKSLVKLVIAK